MRRTCRDTLWHRFRILVLAIGCLATFGIKTTQADRIYWTSYTGRAIYRANLDRSDIEEIVSYDPFGPNRPLAIAVDSYHKRVFWTNGSLLTFANLDGTSIEPVAVIPELFQSIALDISDGQIYWTTIYDGLIGRVHYQGVGITTILAGIGRASGIALDVPSGKMYWTNDVDQGIPGKIQRANLNGSGIEDLVSVSELSLENIALDLMHRKMYWVEAGGGRIRRAGMDGTNVEDLFGELTDPIAIALDAQRNKLYWTDHGGDFMHRSNLDGTDAELFLTGLDNCFSVALELNCGNGRVDLEETCDIAIAPGTAGSCPTACDDADACTIDDLLTEDVCSIWCDHEPITDRLDNDGCCPQGADATTDNDCEPVVGNGICEPGEDESNSPEDCAEPIPAATTWGLAVMTLLLMTGARIHFGR